MFHNAVKCWKKSRNGTNIAADDKTWLGYFDVSAKARNKVWMLEDEEGPWLFENPVLERVVLEIPDIITGK